MGLYADLYLDFMCLSKLGENYLQKIDVIEVVIGVVIKNNKVMIKKLNKNETE